MAPRRLNGHSDLTPGDQVRLTYGDGSGCEGTWEDMPDGPALRLG
jgi:hypothetical protein